jgi:hypothetical protein
MYHDEIKYELFEWVDDNLFGLGYGDKQDQLIALILEVLLRIPSEDRNIIMYKRGVRFFVTSENCVAEQLFIPPNKDKDDESMDMIEMWLVCLNPDFFKNKREESIYTIARELARVYLGHSRQSDVSDTEELSYREIEADRQVIRWNFGPELRQTRFNYIYEKGGI